MDKSLDFKNSELFFELDRNIALIKGVFKKDAVLRIRYCTGANGLHFGIVFFDGMVNSMAINESVVRPLILTDTEPWSDIAAFTAERVLHSSEAKVQDNLSEIIRAVLYGDTAVFTDGSNKAVTVNTKGWRTRGISEPQNERILEGPREGFDEAAMFNLAMIRRKLLTPDFAVEMMRVGRRSDTYVFICYLDSLADPALLAELKQRLQKIDIDGILDSNYIGEEISDKKTSLFNTVGKTERPDRVAANLLEGRIAIVCDGTPIVLTLPYLFSENFQSDEDYYINYKMATVGRIFRIACFWLSICAAGLFLALTTFHLELLPTSFALFIANSREGVPFSPVAESIFLILIFEILKEAGRRMPESVGHALSIVGGLVIGQAAVEAKIVSAPLLIAVAGGGIAGLCLPRMRTAVFFCRIALTLLAALFGLFGMIIGTTLILSHIFALSSFGSDATQSFNHITWQSVKDTFWRAPWNKMVTRPETAKRNRRRQKI